MKIRTLQQVNSRWHDGRTYSAMAGTESYVDDADTDAVAHMRSLADRRLVEILPEPPHAPPAPEPAPEPATKAAIQDTPAEPKKAVAAPKTARAGRSA